MRRILLLSVCAMSAFFILCTGAALAASAGDAATHGEQAVCPNPHTGNDGTTGANASGAYDSTCDGTESDNGNGNSASEPCAGCVGNADDKNPPGQAPDGTDSNNGYECDGNNGVGQTNPAHTGCENEPPACTEHCNEIPEVPTHLIILGGLLGMSAIAYYMHRRRRGDDHGPA